MVHHAIRMADGSVAIMQTVGDATPEECMAKWPLDEQAKVVTHQMVDPATIPADRSFRDAWTHDGKDFAVDMVKARDIHRDRMRVERAPLLVELDTAYIMADETGDTAAKADVVAQKVALRDATDDPRIDAAGTADELKALTLDAVVPSKTLTQVSEVVKD